MKKHKQLALKQRYKIQCLLHAGFTQIKTASLTGAHRSTISRELKRNILKQGRIVNQYVAEQIQLKSNAPHLSKHKQVLLTEQLKQRTASLLEYKK
jgi:IS30 family transposase